MFNWISKKNNKKNKRIYFDSASAVPVLEIAKKSFLETVEKSFANASSIHTEGEYAKELLYDARKKVASYIRAKVNDVHFASSTTEANNIFIKGVVLRGGTAPHIIYSQSDHSAIVDVVESCVAFGAEISSITPNKIGLLQIEDFLKELKENTKLICFSYVSSELGTIQPVRKIVRAVEDFYKKNFPGKARAEYPKIFIDATQAAKYESMDVGNLLVDGMSFGSSKLGGVPGAAALYVRSGTRISSIISGGGQEEGVRSGTENLPAIVAFGEVLSTPPSLPSKEYVYSLRNYCIDELNKNFITNLNFQDNNPSLTKEGRDEVRGDFELEIFGDTKFKYNKFYENATPHILLLSLVDMIGEETLLRLDAKGIAVSTASACSLLENSGSNFLRIIGEPVKAKETIRLSFSESNTKEEIDYFVKTLREIKNKFIK